MSKPNEQGTRAFQGDREALGWDDGLMPLAEFSPEHRARIEAAVAAPKPPPRMLRTEFALIPNRAWLEWHLARGVDPRQGRKRLEQWVIDRVIERDGNLCGICGEPIEEPPHIDHIHPWSRGGSDQPSNLQVAHPACNIKKGARVL